MRIIHRRRFTGPVVLAVLVAASAAAWEGDTVPAPAKIPRSVSEQAGRILFTSDREANYDIYVINSDGTGETRLTSDPAKDYRPAWSPDGAHIAFESDRDGNGEIYTMSADGSDVRRITHNRSHESRPAWSPDGAHIAFASNRSCTFDLYVMRLDGSDQRRLTESSDNDRNPDWCCQGLAVLARADVGREGGFRHARSNQPTLVASSGLCAARRIANASSRVALAVLALLGFGLAMLMLRRGRSLPEDASSPGNP